MTSPARVTTTVSPMRMSLRRISSSLCSVARSTSTPPMRTGSMIATGVTTPVRPTENSTSRSVVCASRGGNLTATAQRGLRETAPSRSWLAIVVDLDDHAVDLEGQIVAPGLQPPVVRGGGLDSRRRAPTRGATGRPQERSASSVSNSLGGREPGAVADAVEEDGQRPGGADPRVELAQRTGRGVARVGEGRRARFLALPVESREVARAHDHLAAHLEVGGGRQRPVGAQAQRQRADGPEVRADLLAGRPVAAGRAGDEAPCLVDHLDGETVELRLERRSGSGSSRAEEAPDALVELGELLDREGVLQAEHRHPVAHRGERAGRGRPDAPGRRVGRRQFGVGRLELQQFAQQAVVGRVGDLGVVEDVVAVVVLLDGGAQRVDSRRDFRSCRAHGRSMIA